MNKLLIFAIAVVIYVAVNEYTLRFEGMYPGSVGAVVLGCVCAVFSIFLAAALVKLSREALED